MKEELEEEKVKSSVERTQTQGNFYYGWSIEVFGWEIKYYNLFRILIFNEFFIF